MRHLRHDGGVEDLFERVRALLAARDDVVEKRMVGGRSFLVGGRLACGVNRAGLVVRVGREGMAAALDRPHALPMTMGEQTLDAYVVVEPEGLATEESLAAWVRTGVDAVSR